MRISMGKAPLVCEPGPVQPGWLRTPSFSFSFLCLFAFVLLLLFSSPIDLRHTHSLTQPQAFNDVTDGENNCAAGDGSGHLLQVRLLRRCRLGPSLWPRYVAAAVVCLFVCLIDCLLCVCLSVGGINYQALAQSLVYM